ncbi:MULTISPECIES: hypothetical protein [unclassified Coleofasciculus]|nr:MULTISPECIES: hypothetical protein [unclassified Coleofasciculus]
MSFCYSIMGVNAIASEYNRGTSAPNLESIAVVLSDFFRLQ